MKMLVTGVLLLSTSVLFAQNAAAPSAMDAWKALNFLEGTWKAKTESGSAGASGIGTYTFQRELKGHVLVRNSTNDGCKGPETFDCQHSDLLYIYQDAKDEPLRAIYFDNEGHVIHYEVSTPDAQTAILTSEASKPGPQFRLVYNRKNAVMSGKFQMRMPGQTEWKSYLEWSGARK